MQGPEYFTGTAAHVNIVAMGSHAPLLLNLPVDLLADTVGQLTASVAQRLSTQAVRLFTTDAHEITGARTRLVDAGVTSGQTLQRVDCGRWTGQLEVYSSWVGEAGKDDCRDALVPLMSETAASCVPSACGGWLVLRTVDEAHPLYILSAHTGRPVARFFACDVLCNHLGPFDDSLRILGLFAWRHFALLLCDREPRLRLVDLRDGQLAGSAWVGRAIDNDSFAIETCGDDSCGWLLDRRGRQLYRVRLRPYRSPCAVIEPCGSAAAHWQGASKEKEEEEEEVWGFGVPVFTLLGVTRKWILVRGPHGDVRLLGKEQRDPLHHIALPLQPGIDDAHMLLSQSGRFVAVHDMFGSCLQFKQLVGTRFFKTEAPSLPGQISLARWGLTDQLTVQTSDGAVWRFTYAEDANAFSMTSVCFGGDRPCLHELLPLDKDRCLVAYKNKEAVFVREILSYA
jgi:hypothetical protein